MNYNRSMISHQKEAKALSGERRHPTQKLVRLLNQYHSVSLMYGTEEYKEATKQELRRQINRLSKDIPISLRAHIPIWLDNKEEWEYSRERIHT